LFTAPVAETLSAPQTIYSQRDGNLPVMFQIRLNNQQTGRLYYAFVNRSYDNDGKIIYPVSSRGSYLIRRDLEKDRIDQIKIFLSRNIGNEQSFIRIFPKSLPQNFDGSQNFQAAQAAQATQAAGPSMQNASQYAEAEVVIFNRVVYSGIPISVPFNDILTMPLHQFIQNTNKAIKWDILLSDPELTEWRLVRQIPDQLRPYLYFIPEVYDGAMDVRGFFVRIETGEPLDRPGFNCSGFIKWVADGVYRSKKKWRDEQLYLDINELKRRQVEVRGGGNPWNDSEETARDPYFGLDWARAIAQKLMAMEVEYPLDVRAGDVQDIPFFNYFENVGYPIAKLNAMMYLLAVKNPGDFYLGAINGTFGEPPLHQYYHEVVFFPYFDTDGTFQLVIMDTGVERSQDFLEARYKDDYVHLSRIQAPYEYRLAPLNRQIQITEIN
ncbi:MAG: hypothetical protein AAF975_01175, partial [Spirochaetota bacterium]